MRTTLIALLLFIFSSQASFAQKNKIPKPIYDSLDVVYMKDGSFLKGQVIRETTDNLTFSMLGDNEITIRKDLIRKVRNSNPDHYYLYKGRSVKKAGYYFSIDYASNWKADYGVAGGHLHTRFGKMFNETFAVGIATGMDSYDNYTSYHTFIPVLAEIQGYHFKKRVSPYYSFAAGIGIATGHSGYYKQRGDYYKSGLALKTGLGLRFATRRKANYFLEIGYRLQTTVSHSEGRQWIPQFGEYTYGVLDQNITYVRYYYTVGLLF